MFYKLVFLLFSTSFVLEEVEFPYVSIIITDPYYSFAIRIRQLYTRGLINLLSFRLEQPGNRVLWRQSTKYAKDGFADLKYLRGVLKR